MNPQENSPNNLFQNDDNSPPQTGPMISGVPNSFQPPQNSPYAPPANYETQPKPQFEAPQPQNIDPFVPPNYETINSEQNQNESVPEFGEMQDRQIANWQAKEFIVGEKSKTWYIMFVLAVALFLVAAWLIGSWSFALLIVVSAIALAVLRPNQSAANSLSYSLSARGFYIDNKLHEFELFKAFGILQENENFSIIFIPKKRLSPTVSIIFPEENGEQIVDIIGAKLPMEEIHQDAIDKIVRRLKL